MALTPSTMLELGTRMPEFDLPAAGGGRVSSADLGGAPAVLVMFLSNHCPYVQHIRGGLAALGRDYRDRGLKIVAVCSNDVESYPDDSPEMMRREADEHGYVFPYLHDADQSVAKAFEAACTPDLFLFDASRRLVYRGQFDGARPRNDVPVTGSDIRAAADAVLAGRAVPANQIPSAGCNIKWKPGNEPNYASS